MKLRKQLCSAGVTVGMLAGGSIAVLPQAAGAGPVELPTPTSINQTCVGTDELTNAMLGNLGGTLAVTTVITPDGANPATIASGDSASVAFDIEMQLDPTLIDLAISTLGVTSLDIVNFHQGIVATGGGSGGPYNALPSDFNVNLVPLTVPTLAASGTVDVLDDTVATEFELDDVDPLAFTVSIPGVDSGEVDENGDPILVTMVLNLACTADTAPTFGAINAGDPVTTATISGVVTNSASAPIAGAVVDLRDATGINRVALTTTDANGVYTFPDLDFGNYTVYVRPVAGVYQGRWYGGASQRFAATVLNLTASGIDSADLVLPDQGLSISGNVGAGGPAVGATVDLRDATGINRVALTTTDANGNYSFKNLQPGVYSLYVRGVPNYSGLWFSSASQRGGRTQIDATGGWNVSMIDVSLPCIVCGG